MKAKPRRVAVAGLGLIGGSIARDLTRLGWHVTGIDTAPVRRRARAAGAVAASRGRLEDALEQVDVLVIAAPPRASMTLLRRAARVASPHLVVTDVTSVKVPFARAAARFGFAGYVPGHPLAGHEGRGFAASREGLFRGRAWALCPGPATRPSARRTVRGLVRALGARPIELDPARHDRAVAFLSHLPQLVSWALAEAAIRDPVSRRQLALAGPAYRDMTRLARSPQGLWREILAANRTEVARAVAAFQRALAAMPRRPGGRNGERASGAAS